MKIKGIQLILSLYLLFVSIATKKIQLTSWIFLALLYLASNLLSENKKFRTTENLLYVLAATIPFPYLTALFLLYLPFSVFGTLSKKSFMKSYLIGFGTSYIPCILIYLLSTYLGIKLNFMSMLTIFYSLPAVALLLHKRDLDFFEVKNSEAISIVIIIFFASFIASGIVDNQNLFVSNNVREFSRLQPAVEGLSSEGKVPLYNPGTGQGDATYLWLPPGHISHFFTANFLLKWLMQPVMFFNAYSFFILVLSTLSLGVLFSSILNKDRSFLDTLFVTSVTLIIGLNFLFMQKLESIKEFSAFPLAYLMLSMILDNPKKFSEFTLLGLFSALLVTIHSAYGIETIVAGLWILLLRKSYCLKERSEPKQFLKWLASNKLKASLFVIVLAALPIFYIANGHIYKDFVVGSENTRLVIWDIPKNFVSYFKNYYEDHLQLLSFRYPDVARNDDHKAGFFPSFFGAITFLILIFMYKKTKTSSFRIFAFALILQTLTIALFLAPYSYQLGGLFRTAKYFLLIMLGAAILTFIGIIENRKIRAALALITLIAFLHMVPYAKQNINNIHKEYFMSGEIYKEELSFIKNLPRDGRIITYGLFGNAVDYGGNQITKMYFAREDWEVLDYHNRNLYNTKIHSSDSFGNSETLFSKSPIELYNYFRIGGYKYLFTNACHPAGNFIARLLYPTYAKPIYQNQQNSCLVIFIVNDTNYAEKISVLEKIDNSADNSVYNSTGGYRYFAVNSHYSTPKNLKYPKTPIEPVKLEFERLNPTEIIIHGAFEDNGWVSFKETYWPRWKAYTGNYELPIYADNYEQILISTKKGDRILLKYSILPIERIFGIISIFGFLSIAILLLALTKKETNSQSQI